MDQLNSEADIAEAEKVSETAAGKARAAAYNVGDGIRHGAAVVADQVQSKLNDAGVDSDRLAGAARDLSAALFNEIRARPLRAVIAAALAGLVVGALTR